MRHKSFLTLMIIIGILFTSCAENPSHKKTQGGGGVFFYGEPISIGGTEHYVVHSTLSCPRINIGVQRGYHKTHESDNIFCPECMTDELITLFHVRYF